VTCEFLKPAECDDFGGVNFGPGNCDPNPCVATTTTTLLTLTTCTRSATMASVKCRLANLAAMVSGAGDLRGLGTKLRRSLQRAETHLARAGDCQARGQTRRARTSLRHAVHDLKTLTKQLRSRRATKLLSPASRNGMLGLADPLRLDLQAVAPAKGS
jgi:hypothetical protein